VKEIKKGTSLSYAGKKRGKTDYGVGGFGGQPRVSFESISQERWDSIFKKDVDGKEEQTNVESSI
jgi:hypothetical protein